MNFQISFYIPTIDKGRLKVHSVFFCSEKMSLISYNLLVLDLISFYSLMIGLISLYLLMIYLISFSLMIGLIFFYSLVIGLILYSLMSGLISLCLPTMCLISSHLLVVYLIFACLLISFCLYMIEKIFFGLLVIALMSVFLLVIHSSFCFQMTALIFYYFLLNAFRTWNQIFLSLLSFLIVVEQILFRCMLFLEIVHVRYCNLDNSRHV